MGTVILVTTIAPALMLALLAGAIVSSQRQARDRITSIFQSQGAATGAFVARYVVNVARQERVIAEANLAETLPSQREFFDDNVAFGFPAAVLLNDQGRALAVYPPDAALLGTDLATRYAHLQAGVDGLIGVSGVVQSAVRREPVIAIASPFSTPSGRRVYSGAFAVSSTPLGIYLDHSIVVPAHEVYLEDVTGRLISSSPESKRHTLSESAPALSHAIEARPLGTFDRDGTWTYLALPIHGTPWRLVFAESNSDLYRTVSGFSSVAPWLVLLVLAIVATLLAAVFLRSVRDRRRLGELSSHMTQAAETDELTGMANRRKLVRVMEALTRGRRASDERLTVMILDLDKFKTINDTYGHDAGDRALQLVASAMKKVFRETDSFGRWGGDEFVAILTKVSPEDMSGVIARLLSFIEETSLRIGPVLVPLRVSIGVATTPGIGEPVEMDDLLQRADVALYDAKSKGGGMVAWGSSINSRS
jgi:diguanylate cyclase (GGDEF)-like protein